MSLNTNKAQTSRLGFNGRSIATHAFHKPVIALSKTTKTSQKYKLEPLSPLSFLAPKIKSNKVIPLIKLGLIISQKLGDGMGHER